MVKRGPWHSALPGRGAWLSLTPEPERELPGIVATLRRGGTPPPGMISAEEARVNRLILHGSETSWLRYLHGVVELIGGSERSSDPAVAGARARTVQVLANHHNLLLGLPGRAARRTADDRARLDALAHDSSQLKEHR